MRENLFHRRWRKGLDSRNSMYKGTDSVGHYNNKRDWSVEYRAKIGKRCLEETKI